MPDRIRLKVDGRDVEVEAGVSVLVALWNAGFRELRSSVTGEPRGALCGMGTCQECRVSIDGEPHRRSCLEAVREGMEIVLRG